MNEYEVLSNIRDFCTGILFALLDKEIITIEEWDKYLIQAKQKLEQKDAEQREEALANMSPGERVINEILGGFPK